MSDFIFKPTNNSFGNFSGASEVAGIEQGGIVPLPDGSYEIYVKVDSGFVVGAQPTGVTNIFINYGVEGGGTPSQTGVNLIAIDDAGWGSSGLEGPIALIDSSGQATGVSLTMAFSRTDSGGPDGFGPNEDGGSTGTAIFDGTLYNDLFTRDSHFVESGDTATHTLSGLVPDTDYMVQALGSRVTGAARQTRLSFNDGSTLQYPTSSGTPAQPVSTTVTSNAQGEIVFDQTVASGSYAYLGGLRVTAA